MSSASSLQTSDFYVSPLPKPLIEKCRVMYDLYIKAIQNDSSSSNNIKNEEMLPSTLAKLLEDLGVPTTENDARALVFSLSQNAALQIAADESVQRKRVVEHQLQQAANNNSEDNNSGTSANNNNRNQKKRGRASSVDQRSNSRRSSVSQSPRNNSNTVGNSSALPSTHQQSVKFEAPPPSAKLSLSFEMFLRVLQMPFNKSMRELEMQLLWKELDRDGDGVLSKSDIIQSVSRMNASTSKGVPKEVCEGSSASSIIHQQQQKMMMMQNNNKDLEVQSSNGDENVDNTDDRDEQEGRNITANKHDDPNTSARDKKKNNNTASSNNSPSPNSNGAANSSIAVKKNRTALSKAFSANNSRASSSTSKNNKMNKNSKNNTTTTTTTSPTMQQQQSPSFEMLFQSPWMLEDLSEHQLAALIHQLDADGDGSVSFEDLKESLLNV